MALDAQLRPAVPVAPPYDQQRARETVARFNAGWERENQARRENSVLEQLWADQRAATRERMEIERGIPQGGPTSVRNRAIQEEYRRRWGEASRAAADERARRMPQAVVGPAGVATWNGDEWTTRGNQVAESGAGGTVAVNSEGGVTQTPPPEPGADKIVDTETGISLPDAWKNFRRAKDGNKEDQFYKIRMEGAKTPEQRAAIEAEYGPNKEAEEFWAGVLRRMGKDPYAPAPGVGRAVRPGVGAPGAGAAPGTGRGVAPVGRATGKEAWRRR